MTASPSPASVPTEEDVARAIYHGKPRNRPWAVLPEEFKNQYRKQACAVLALFAPILAEMRARLAANGVAEEVDGPSGFHCACIFDPHSAEQLQQCSAHAGLAARVVTAEANFGVIAQENQALVDKLEAAEAALAKMEGALARYIETVGAAEGTDFIDTPGFNGPDEAVLYRCSGRDENGNFTEEARAISAAIRAQE